MANIFFRGGVEGERRKNTVKTLAVRLGGKDNLCSKSFLVTHYLFLKKKELS